MFGWGSEIKGEVSFVRNMLTLSACPRPYANKAPLGPCEMGYWFFVIREKGHSCFA